jgi:ABC-type protease/lipase transport system fused ATPase/permease subunit
MDTPVGEGGAGLSTGQLRRVALARTLCRRAPFVLLDEPSAALDATTEQAVVDAVAALRAAGSTVVLVAHRPALLLAADHVVVLAAQEPAQPPTPEHEAVALAAAAPSAPAWVERA